MESRLWILGLSFWEGNYLVCMPIAPCGRNVRLSKNFVVPTSQLLSAIGGDATIICCRERNTDFIKASDKTFGRKKGLHYPLIPEPLLFEQMLHKPIFSVMVRFDFLSTHRFFLQHQGLTGRTLSSVDRVFRRLNMVVKLGLGHMRFTSIKRGLVYYRL